MDFYSSFCTFHFAQNLPLPLVSFIVSLWNVFFFKSFQMLSAHFPQSRTDSITKPESKFNSLQPNRVKKKKKKNRKPSRKCLTSLVLEKLQVQMLTEKKKKLTYEKQRFVQK